MGTTDTAAALRGAVLTILALGSAGAVVELVLLAHYEDAWQYLPLVTIGLAALVTIWHLMRPSHASIRSFQLLMAAFVASGALGVWLHFKGAAEFQREMDPSMDWWTMAIKALHSKAPPVLAPGLMAQLGLLGLLYSFRNPALSRGRGSDRVSQVRS